jgi:HEAT repeat protein
MTKKWGVLLALERHPSGKKYEPALRRALKDPDRAIRQMAAVGLAQLGHADEPILDELVRGLGEPWEPSYYSSPDDAHAAQRALVRLGAKAVPALAAAVETSQGSARSHAISALMKIGPAAKPALPALTKSMRDTRDVEYADLVEAKYRIDGDAAYAVRELVPLLDTPEGRSCYGANRVLARMGADTKEAVPALIRAMRKYKADEIVYDLKKLAPHFHDQVVAALRDIQDDPDLAAAAASALRDIRRKK